ncbi:D-alanyl-D-alanine endopeptidase [Methylotenera versatilis]|uniref:D-alanyl-D-alanine endopeptidase n=1 Tax=Methylotenera versatilis TaxID=1055487 RepID=UPI0006459343|nr:D-alanyl-D-alanine endopeptidase [Methylotenera versatilis]
MNKLFKRIVLLYVAFSLVAMPIQSMAEPKKTNKRVSTSQKNTASKARVKSSKVVKKVNLKTRTTTHKVRTYTQAEYLAADRYDGSGILQLASAKALIINQNTGEVIYAKNTNIPTPIASITKLMTAMVMLDAQLSLDDMLTVSDEDVDYLKGSSSRLSVGATLSRGDMLQLALMASENRAASAISRYYPGGKYAFFKAMNAKALQLGMVNTEFMDATGLNSRNISTAEDLTKMVAAAYQYPEIRMASTSPSHEVYVQNRAHSVNFNNTNGLVRGGEWQIGLSKTGYISEAGRCLVMQAQLGGEPMIIVLLDSNGKLTRIGDANRVRKWVEYNSEPKLTTTGQVDLQHETFKAKPARGHEVTSGRIS